MPHVTVRFSYKDSRGRARSGDLAILMYRQGLYVVGARVGEGYASADLHDWRRGFGVFAVERFVEARHVRKRTFEIPADFKIDEAPRTENEKGSNRCLLSGGDKGIKFFQKTNEDERLLRFQQLGSGRIGPHRPLF